MSENNKYRIAERNGRFTIEIYDYDIVGFFFRKKVFKWKPTDLLGNVWTQNPSRPSMQRSKSFKSLSEAIDQIKKWKSERESETIYHEYEEIL